MTEYALTEGRSDGGSDGGSDGRAGGGRMASTGLWWRWSLRELRQRLLLVVAIAVMIGLGTGLYAGLTSSSHWRRQSYDASYARLNVHDLRVSVGAGATVAQGRLAAVVRSLPAAAAVTADAERLVLPTEIDASRPGHTVLSRGELVGIDLTARPPVDAVSVARGRALVPADSGRDVGVLDRTFANANHLPPTGTVRTSGGGEVRYVGQGQSPEYFILPGEQPGLVTQSGFGVLYTSLPTAQRLTGQPGAVNDLVLTLRPGTDTAAFAAELSQALAAALPGTSVTVTDRDDIQTRQILYDDVNSDQRLWDVLAVLVLVGAVFAAFNLVGRVVDAQRREIGIGMALGVAPRRLALRPLLLGAQVGVLGVVAGVVVGLVVGAAMGALLRGVWPLPVWHTNFQVGVFARAAAVGLVLPVLAALPPVWRAVRVEPVQAIRASAVAGGTGPLVRLLGRARLPGGSLTQMPLRNLARAPRRLLLTAVAIAAVITALVVFTGELDTFTRTTNRAEADLTTSNPDRLRVMLPRVEPVNSPTVDAVRRSPAVAETDPTLALPGRISPAPAGGDASAAPIDVLTYILDIGHGLWSPSVASGSPTGGLLISEKAAHDLGVHPGDTITLRHPQRVGTGYRTIDTPLRIAGIHDFPVRSVVFLDNADAGAFRLAGTTNVVVVQPAAGYGRAAATRTLAAIPGVASVVSATASIEEIRALLRSFVGILRIGEVVVLLLAVLIAYNAMSIAVDERRREHATMLAYGLSTRTVLGLSVAESAAMGLIGTLLGIAAGYWALRYTVEVLLAKTLPDLGVQAILSGRTLAVILLLGVGAVAIAPLAAARRIRRMDVPSTLRVIE
ncbi:FtsX-like permease family protein [Frankia sp. AiPs1]|uniref:ABC transporter permease n=1 Tax=Frankia sp. AiPs1 TaxID=573493 RepID=UPI0020448E4E|nr:FtsX-like permease family protein [Frankia sp. AiPs1]MCM3924028.1 FtsX-like permease family protein [Frankia sp. AiPs1]